MPALPPPTDPPWKQAWDNALFGPSGYLRSRPVPFSRPRDAVLSVSLSKAAELSAAEAALLGAAGELAPDLAGAGLDVRFDVPPGFGGLVVAVDWLAHVPTHVVEVFVDGHPRLVHVATSGREALGARLSETSVPQSIGLWLTEWWPVVDHGVGARAEVGTSRDAAWAGVVRRLAPGGVALAFEPGHLADSRPPGGTLASPSEASSSGASSSGASSSGAAPSGAAPAGPPIPDGSHDLSAAVALDSVAAASGGRVVAEAGLFYVESGPA